MIAERDIEARLFAGELQFAPFRFEVEPVRPTAGRLRPDAFLTVEWQGMTVQFVAEVANRVSAKVLQEKIVQLMYMSEQTGRYPLLIADWLTSEQLDLLESADVSGIDLCGNGVMTVPGKLLVRRSGQGKPPRITVPLKNPYRGESALVARVLLLQREFAKVEDIRAEILRRNGSLSLASVSKALKVLEADLMISRRSGIIRVLQAELLLKRLVAEYRPPTAIAKWTGRLEVAEADRLRSIVAAAAAELVPFEPAPQDLARIPVVLTGSCSGDKYAVPLLREPLLSFYVAAPMPQFLQRLSLRGELTETRLFPNLELIATNEHWPLFDARRDDGSQMPLRIWASPVQTYLELVSGDQRERDASARLQERLLRGEVSNG